MMDGLDDGKDPWHEYDAILTTSYFNYFWEEWQDNHVNVVPSLFSLL